MPGRDGKGPQGAGPGTGGRRGACFTGTTSVGSADDVRGAGRGFAPRGGGRGRAFGGGRGPVKNDTEQNLKNRAVALEKELAELRKLLDANQKETEEAMAQLVDKMAKETTNVINSAMKAAAGGGGGGASAGGGDFEEYKVQPGATLHTIAKAYGVSVEAIQKANNLKGDSIKEGQLLKIPKKK